MLIGEYSYNMDVKGRMNFPTVISGVKWYIVVENSVENVKSYES